MLGIFWGILWGGGIAVLGWEWAQRGLAEVFGVGSPKLQTRRVSLLIFLNVGSTSRSFGGTPCRMTSGGGCSTGPPYLAAFSAELAVQGDAFAGDGVYSRISSGIIRGILWGDARRGLLGVGTREQRPGPRDRGSTNQGKEHIIHNNRAQGLQEYTTPNSNMHKFALLFVPLSFVYDLLETFRWFPDCPQGSLQGP